MDTPANDLTAEKAALRKTMRAARKALPLAAKRAYDTWVVGQLQALIQDKKAKVVHAYLPMAGEINIAPLLSQLLDAGIKVVCPKTLPHRQLENRVLHALSDVEMGVMKTYHPAQPDLYEGPFDIIIVPGLACNDQGYRLGYGGGYYDTFLAKQADAYKVGIFYPFQKVKNLPLAPYDVPLDDLIVGEMKPV